MPQISISWYHACRVSCLYYSVLKVGLYFYLLVRPVFQCRYSGIDLVISFFVEIPKHVCKTGFNNFDCNLFMLSFSSMVKNI